jgi:Ca-activated chloride channel family protein
LFAVLAAGGVASAQAPIERRPPSDQPLPTLKLTSRLVTVAVNAVDDKGAPVAGLKQEDFRLLEDGKEQKIAFFDKEAATPLSIALAIDGSASVLRDERLMMTAARRFERSLLRPDKKDELDLIEFDDTVRELVAFTADRDKIEGGLARMTRGDATAMYDAIYLASQRLGETSSADGRRRVLVMITDGGDDVSHYRYDAALEQAERAGVSVYTLIVVPIAADAGRNTGGEHALIQMAEDTGGKYYYVESTKDLSAAFQQVSDDLRTQYVLGYYAPERTVRNRSDGFRTLKVELTDPALRGKVSLRSRTGYYAERAVPPPVR